MRASAKRRAHPDEKRKVMNIIIIGSGKVGSTIAEHITEEGHSVVMIDLNGERLDNIANKIDIMTLEGNGASRSVLVEAGVVLCDILIAVTNSDEVNLYCCLMAKKCGAKNTIARVRNHAYMNDIHLVHEELGLSLSINPELNAAREMARLIKFPGAIEIDRFAKGGVELFKIKLPEGSRLGGKKLRDIAGSIGDFKICAVERDDEVYIPLGDFELESGDNVYTLARSNDAYEMFKMFDIQIETGKNALIVGGSSTAIYLAKQLSESRMSVKLIEIDPEKCEMLSELLPEVNVLNGDGLDRDLLIEEGIESVDAFCSLTGMDEENIILSMYAKSVSNAKVITKVNKIPFDDIINKLDVGSIIRPKDLTGEYITQYVRAMDNSQGSNVESLYRIVNGKAEALEFYVKDNPTITDIPLKNLDLKDNLLIGSIRREGYSFVPSGDDVIKPEDSVIVVTSHKKLNDLQDILK